jgi:hypothetical protein
MNKAFVLVASALLVLLSLGQPVLAGLADVRIDQ